MDQTDAGYQAALKFDLDHEGRYYTNTPGDAGGPTRDGITWIDGNQWRVRNGMPALTITEAANCQLSYLNPTVVSEIYFTKYYQVFDPSSLGGIVSEVLFDCAVNTGVATSVKEAQRECGLPADGVWGNNTEAGVLAYIAKHGKRALCCALIARRRGYYAQVVAAHPGDEEFIKGWLARCDDIQAAVDAVVPAPA